MFCKNCGAKIADQSTFCPNCGAKTQPAVAQQRPAAQPATSLQSVVNVGGDVTKLLNYVTLICFALAGFLWIYAGITKGDNTTKFGDYYFDISLAYLPVMIGQGFFASAIATFFVLNNSKIITKKTGYLFTAITGCVTFVLSVCSIYAALETKKAEMGDMNFAGWMVIVLGLLGIACAITNYVQSKKN